MTGSTVTTYPILCSSIGAQKCQHSFNGQYLFFMDNNDCSKFCFCSQDFKLCAYADIDSPDKTKLPGEIFTAVKGVTTSPDVISFSAGGLFDYLIVEHDAYFNSCLKHVCLSPKQSCSHIYFLIKKDGISLTILSSHGQSGKISRSL